MKKIEPLYLTKNKTKVYEEKIENNLLDIREIRTFYDIYLYKDTYYALRQWCDSSLEMIRVYPRINERYSLTPYDNCKDFYDINFEEILNRFKENLLGYKEYRNKFKKIIKYNHIFKNNIIINNLNLKINLEVGKRYYVKYNETLTLKYNGYQKQNGDIWLIFLDENNKKEYRRIYIKNNKYYLKYNTLIFEINNIKTYKYFENKLKNHFK